MNDIDFMRLVSRVLRTESSHSEFTQFYNADTSFEAIATQMIAEHEAAAQELCWRCGMRQTGASCFCLGER